LSASFDPSGTVVSAVAADETGSGGGITKKSYCELSGGVLISAQF